MRTASYRSAPYGGSLRSRLVAALLSLALAAGLILLLMTLGVLPASRPVTDILATFDVRPQAPVESRSAPAAASAPSAERADDPPPPPPPVTPPPPPAPTIWPQEIIALNRETFAATDIAGIKSAPSPAADAGVGRRTRGRGAGDSEVVGTGPDGQPLYSARWHRKPTRAEMVTYLPHRTIQGDRWGMIICRTIERNRVDDCRELGESPGSGLAGAMRQAAWQFQIRPPYVGGEPLIGAWVRIRFDYVEQED